jgi:hypothetical protein
VESPEEEEHYLVAHGEEGGESGLGWCVNRVPRPTGTGLTCLIHHQAAVPVPVAVCGGQWSLSPLPFLSLSLSPLSRSRVRQPRYPAGLPSQATEKLLLAAFAPRRCYFSRSAHSTCAGVSNHPTPTIQPSNLLSRPAPPRCTPPLAPRHPGSSDRCLLLVRLPARALTLTLLNAPPLPAVLWRPRVVGRPAGRGRAVRGGVRLFR